MTFTLVTPKFKQGDIVTVNGQLRAMQSWPSTNEGPFVTAWLDGDVLRYESGWAGHVDNAFHSSDKPDEIVMVTEAGEQKSTAAELPAAVVAAAVAEADAVVEAGLAADAKKAGTHV